ncbi:P-loop NTPase fold protein [Streptomyces sp. NBC_00401]|uniref:KAP family P-loop NTPase fold protein n=1 Tax=Streptomyces sp. NBC_00401 TaxID=2975738 RepID=UPI00224CA54C|nr:P-loop NTPase fold protein [Streptomyces sp. NBC_00401]MCX5081775.1 KAP family NTPase [Streptomyces sp. NBC_00401]
MTDPVLGGDGQSALFSGDDPILVSGDDLLNRSRLAVAIADEVQQMNAERGAVVAITGRWGTGKTSLLNLTANILREQESIQVVEFNPWFFSGTDQLIRFFFDEMTRQLRNERSGKKRLKDATANIAEKFSKYSTSLSPVKFIPGVGQVFDVAQKAAEGVSQAFAASVQEQRVEISEALTQLNGRIVVLIDDIDRLTRQEIRDLFRLVRLNGSFPNVVYLLCFDRQVVEIALSEDGLNGAAYLEKIVKTSMEVPPAADEALASVLRLGMNTAIADVKITTPDESRFPDVFWQVVRPLFSTVRDVKRFLSSLGLAIRFAADEVALPDLVALEAIRVMRPDAHDLIAQNVRALTAVYSWQVEKRNQGILAADAEVVTALQGELPDGVGLALIRFVFPAAQAHTENMWHGNDSLQAWRRDRRVAHATVLKYYLHRELPSGAAPSSEVDSIVYFSGDEQEFRDALAAIPDAHLEDALDRFLSHVEAIDSSRIPSVVVALLDLLPRFSEEASGMYDLAGRDYTALRPSKRLMQRVEPASADPVARAIYQATSSAYARLSFLSLVGAQTHSEGQIISPNLEVELRTDLGEFLKSAPAAVLSTERELLRTVVQAINCDANSGEVAIASANSPNVTARLLETAISSSRSNTLGSVVVESEDRLAWDALISVYGGESRLSSAVEQLKESFANQEISPRLRRGIAAFDLYVTGWRPADF